jgi:hypothetical protein
MGPGFDQSFIDKMYPFFDANINIAGLGGVTITSNRSEFAHYVRDAGVIMRSYMEINTDLKKVEDKMKAYVGWVSRAQQKVDPYGYDIRLNPKFQLPNGEVFIGAMCRPSTDGPGLRAAAFVQFANMLLDDKQDYYTLTVLPLIKYDIDWILSSWQAFGCDIF